MEAKEIAILCGRLAYEKKGKDIVILEVKGLTYITDYFLITSGVSERHVKTIFEHIEKEMKEKMGITPYSVEGIEQGRWVIIDYNDVVVHVFLDKIREFYDLESLWYEAKRIHVDQDKKAKEV